MTTALPRHLKDEVTMAEDVLTMLFARRRTMQGEPGTALPAALEASTQFAQIMARDGRPELARHDEARRRGAPRLRDGRISHYTVE